MKNNVMAGFVDEMQKQAIPLPLMKLLSPVKAWRAGVRGRKAFMRQIDNEIRQLKFKDPGFDAAGHRAKRLQELETEGREAVQKALTEGKNTVPGGESFFKKHKGKILLGGAVAGGLYLANKMNESEDERRQQIAMSRGYNIPQRVMYQ